jgi:hypothetical protein
MKATGGYNGVGFEFCKENGTTGDSGPATP